jgi:hypothetical protein
MIKQSAFTALDNEVCTILGIEQERLFWLRMESGCVFLEHWIGTELIEERKLMEQLPDFWTWWMQVWHTIDLRFANRFKGRNAEMKVYEAIHNPKTLAYRPNRVIMEGYHRLIKKQVNQPLTNQL